MAAVCNAGWARPRQPLEADDCLWRAKPKPEEIHEAARHPAHVARVVKKLKSIFPGLR